MAITADSLLESSALRETDFGFTNRLNALSWISAEILPLAQSEVDVPLRSGLGGYDSIEAVLLARYPDDDVTRAAVSDAALALRDAAIISYARSELNKRVQSPSPDYDRDSDQDRIQGNQRLAKLLALIEGIVSGLDTTEPTDVPKPHTVRMRPVFW